MKEHPILFMPEMVQAYLAGRKWQTRRVIKLPKWSTETWDNFELDDENYPVIVDYKTGCLARIPCPYGQPSDSLWVKETWRIVDRDFDPGMVRVGYKASPEPYTTKSELYTKVWSPWMEVGNDYAEQFNKHTDRENDMWRPSLFMPRWASRISFPIVSIRAERVQDISVGDAIAEGVEDASIAWEGMGDALGLGPKKFVMAYKNLWNSINVKRGYGWDNPTWPGWVWVIEFPKYEAVK